MNPFLLGSGYYDGGYGGAAWFADLWMENTLLFTDPLPVKIVVLSVGGSRPPYPTSSPDGMMRFDIIDLPGNAGHVHDLNGIGVPGKPYHYCGVTATFITLAMMAYLTECDFVYKEQDCLAFGPWVDRMNGFLAGPSDGMCFGRCKVLKSAQSVFMIRHGFIPTFVQFLLNEGSERGVDNLPEYKFTRLMQRYPSAVKYFDFGYDRDRPLNMDDTVWYAQKFTPDELRALADRGLITLKTMPETVATFTNP